MKIVLFELNEVPFRILDDFCTSRPQSNFAKYVPRCHQFTTYSEDVSPLSPWLTWPSLHRGVTDAQHTIVNIGQDLREVDLAYPPLWQILAQNKIKVGVFGSLHSHPLPAHLDAYSFYVPDPFAAESSCHPEELSSFQKFNLEASRESSRNIAKGFPIKLAFDFLKDAPRLGVKLSTFATIAAQLAQEKLNPTRKVRRRTYQGVLGFDIFWQQLNELKPDFVSFFTNHVASAMHRYWAAKFPGDYENFSFTPDWVESYGGEIDFAMQKADQMFGKLVQFANLNPEYSIWVTTSMGQNATVSQPIETQLYLKDLPQFMRHLGVNPQDWQSRPAMLPQCNVQLSSNVESFRQRLSVLKVVGVPLEFREEERGFFSLDFGQQNLKTEDITATLDGATIPYQELGLENVEIEDKSGCTAYHIPQGMLLTYNPKAQKQENSRSEISTLDFCPTILKNFGISTPHYMRPVNSSLAGGLAS